MSSDQKTITLSTVDLGQASIVYMWCVYGRYRGIDGISMLHVLIIMDDVWQHGQVILPCFADSMNSSLKYAKQGDTREGEQRS